jgi:3-polyprenyl-4-hydroxybenzoate decarboxylase|tara:strand:- start:1647 stop:1865 length:219 start_codon:yes stop_codon:yes gene_type:complete
MSEIKQLFNEINRARPPRATREELDELGFLLDKMEVTEAYMHSSSCTAEEYSESEVELKTLCDRVDLLMEIV